MPLQRLLRFRAMRGVTTAIAVRPDCLKNVDVKTLDQGSSERCFLGQVFGNFEKGMAALNLEPGPRAVWLGYQLSIDELACGWHEDWNKAWRDYLDWCQRNEE